jgi:copper chaperone CopZ
MKKIDLQTLDDASRKVSLGKARKGLMGLAIVLVLAGGGYAAFRLFTGEVVASRFTVSNMYCPACVVTVKEASTKVPGVVDADISLAGGDVIVKYREKQTGPNQIQEAIAKAGYPIKLDGIFKLDGSGVDESVVATVNGKPVFAKDVSLPMSVTTDAGKAGDPAAAFFSQVGKEILLQAADSKTIVVQPQEIDEEVQNIMKNQGMNRDQFVAWVSKTYGSPEKYNQVVGQRLGIRKMIDEVVIEGVKDPEAKKHKTMEWAGALFKDANVQLVDPKFKEKLHAAVGQDDWKTFWPRMIGQTTELKSLLMQ